MTERHITIGPEFFAKTFNDYANWHWAMPREFFQNSIDCGSRNITVKCYNGSELPEDEWEDGYTYLDIENDGDPMDEQILVEKLFALGGSGKNFDGENTGGFGKAKEILYFCHNTYLIHTGNLEAKGRGATYTLTETDKYLHGTRSRIVIDGEHAEDLLAQIKWWIDLAQCKVQFTINGERRTCDMKKGSPRRDLGFGKVYSNKSGEYQMVVRINGMPMFTERTNLNRLVIVELHGNSAEVMTSNRDGLVRPFSSELTEFVTELAVDKRSALRNHRGPRYTEYRGTKLCHRSALNVAEVVDATEIQAVLDEREYPTDEEAVEVEVGEVIDDTPGDGPVEGISVIDGDETFFDDDDEEFFGTTDRTGMVHRAAARAEFVETRHQVATLGTNFILKNETDLKIPKYYDPGSGALSSYSHKLIRYWGRIMMEMHKLFDQEAEFSIGFIFDEGDVYATEAECEQGDYGLVYYLNPCKIVEQDSSYSKSFKKRFKLTERDRLIMIGVHEFVHATGNSWHDEHYANKLTDMAAFVMKHRKRFNWCFR